MTQVTGILVSRKSCQLRTGKPVWWVRKVEVYRFYRVLLYLAERLQWGTMAGVRSLGRIVPKTSALFLCDMQEKFRPMISYFDQVVLNSNRVLNAVKIMDMPALATEQYPKVSCFGKFWSQNGTGKLTPIFFKYQLKLKISTKLKMLKTWKCSNRKT